MILRLLLLLLFPLVLFSQSKKDQIENLERLLANTKVKKAELEIELDTCNDELDLCNDKAFTLETEKNNIKTELQNRIDVLKIKLDSLYVDIDNYETLIFNVNRLEEDVFYRDSIIKIKDELIESLENQIENQEKGNSVNSDFFITKLYQGDEKIKNQTFNLRFEGVLDANNFSEYFKKNTIIRRFHPTDELFLKVYPPRLETTKNIKGDWVSNCNTVDEFVLYKKNNFLTGVLPELSFIKGKLVTISNDYKKQNFSVDFLFSISDLESTKNDLYDGMYFSFTKEGEDLNDKNPPIFVPLIVIQNRVYLILNNPLLDQLQLGFNFVTVNPIGDPDNDGAIFIGQRRIYAEYKYKTDDYVSDWEECSWSSCYGDYYDEVDYRCNRPILIEIFKKSDRLKSEKRIQVDKSDYFLFELIEQD